MIYDCTFLQSSKNDISAISLPGPDGSLRGTSRFVYNGSAGSFETAARLHNPKRDALWQSIIEKLKEKVPVMLLPGTNIGLLLPCPSSVALILADVLKDAWEVYCSPGCDVQDHKHSPYDCDRSKPLCWRCFV